MKGVYLIPRIEAKTLFFHFWVFFWVLTKTIKNTFHKPSMADLKKLLFFLIILQEKYIVDFIFGTWSNCDYSLRKFPSVFRVIKIIFFHSKQEKSRWKKIVFRMLFVWAFFLNIRKKKYRKPILTQIIAILRCWCQNLAILTKIVTILLYGGFVFFRMFKRKAHTKSILKTLFFHLLFSCLEWKKNYFHEPEGKEEFR